MLGKLCLLIADKDEDYLKRLGDYYMVHYSSRFNIHLFSSRESLSCFLDANERQPDILLISAEIACDFPAAGRVRAIIELVDSGAQVSGEKSNGVFKYQHCESLVKDMLHIYSKAVQNTPAPEGKKTASIFAVHSASGGAGCTSIAAALSILAARRNLKPLYISLEGTSSASFHFKGHCERTFSDILYYLKEGGTNLCLKLESGCCSDPVSGVHYFLPPDSINELEELADSNIILMLETLKASGQFDMIIIDLSPGLSRRNCLIYNMCDRVINVCSYNIMSLMKNSYMQKDPGLGSMEPSEGLSSKILHVINRYRDNKLFSVNEQDYSDIFEITIRESEMLGMKLGGELLTDIDPAFTASVAGLLEILAAGGTVHA